MYLELWMRKVKKEKTEKKGAGRGEKRHLGQGGNYGGTADEKGSTLSAQARRAANSLAHKKKNARRSER